MKKLPSICLYRKPFFTKTDFISKVNRIFYSVKVAHSFYGFHITAYVYFCKKKLDPPHGLNRNSKYQTNLFQTTAWRTLTILGRGARFTCSYEKEKRALEVVVHWLQTGVGQNSSVAVFTDSQSLCVALLLKSTGLDPFRFNFRGLKDK